MQRIALTDEQGLPTASWFDCDRAKSHREGTHWDGNNNASDATGSPHVHEMLYRTATGKWVLNRWSAWQGARETYREIAEAEAYAWLLAQGHADAVPQEEIAAREVGVGETPRRTIRIGDDLWTRAQDRAREEGGDASKLIVRLLSEYVG